MADGESVQELRIREMITGSAKGAQRECTYFGIVRDDWEGELRDEQRKSWKHTVWSPFIASFEDPMNSVSGL
jgi:hypothetical protein